jgi:hypothetical protein
MSPALGTEAGAGSRSPFYSAPAGLAACLEAAPPRPMPDADRSISELDWRVGWAASSLAPKIFMRRTSDET